MKLLGCTHKDSGTHTYIVSTYRYIRTYTYAAFVLLFFMVKYTVCVHTVKSPIKIIVAHADLLVSPGAGPPKLRD